MSGCRHVAIAPTGQRSQQEASTGWPRLGDFRIHAHILFAARRFRWQGQRPCDNRPGGGICSLCNLTCGRGALLGCTANDTSVAGKAEWGVGVLYCPVVSAVRDGDCKSMMIRRMVKNL